MDRLDVLGGLCSWDDLWSAGVDMGTLKAWRGVMLARHWEPHHAPLPGSRLGAVQRTEPTLTHRGGVEGVVGWL